MAQTRDNEKRTLNTKSSKQTTSCRIRCPLTRTLKLSSEASRTPNTRFLRARTAFGARDIGTKPETRIASHLGISPYIGGRETLVEHRRRVRRRVAPQIHRFSHRHVKTFGPRNIFALVRSVDAGIML